MKPNSLNKKGVALRCAINNVLAELGSCLREEEGDICCFTYEDMEYLVFIVEEDGVFSLMQYVVGLNDSLTEQQFNTALESVKDDYPDYGGDWNNGCAYFASPFYTLPSSGMFDKVLFEVMVKEFIDAWTLMTADVCWMTDSSLWESFEK